jgi:hypothetical protein
VRHTTWLRGRTLQETTPDLTILEALALSSRWHLWVITTPDGNIQLERHCKQNMQGGCQHHSYWLTSDNGRASNAATIETAFDQFDDDEQRQFLRTASLSPRWTFYGIAESEEAPV